MTEQHITESAPNNVSMPPTSAWSLLPKWTIITPVIAWLLYGAAVVFSDVEFFASGLFHAFQAAALMVSVLAAVHHADVVAHRVGEPFGSLVLAVAVTLIEVALIVSLMIAGGASETALARDTVFAAVMIIMNGIVGMCLLVGGLRHSEQRFGLEGVSAALTTLAAIIVLTLILPNYTNSVAGPVFSNAQLAFIAVVALVLYGTFVMSQTMLHRRDFLSAEAEQEAADDQHKPDDKTAAISLGLLLVCLAAVVLLAKKLAPSIEQMVTNIGAPKALVGVIIAGVVLLPEGLAAVKAARDNRLQTSLNLAFGSALASIGMTIPAVAIVSIFSGLTLTLGIDAKATALLLLSMFVSVIALQTGRTTVLQGMVLLVIFAVYLFTTVVP
jgi:Ca2+:H+ antiporter